MTIKSPLILEVDMTLSTTITLGKLGTFFAAEKLMFVGRASFEERAYSAINELRGHHTINTTLFRSKDETPEAIELRERFSQDTDTLISLNTFEPLSTQMTLRRKIQSMRSLDFDRLVIDISSFRREELLILVRELTEVKELHEKTTLIYCRAKEHGDWLSQNVREVRPVIGFPGEVSSLRKTHLIVLGGIETHRALSIVRWYEPFSISLGYVPRHQAINDDVAERNLELGERLKVSFDQIEDEFEFSPSSVSEVIRGLEKTSEKHSGKNIVIAPLNTKMSTLAVGLFAIAHPECQLCYAEVEIYNSKSYSSCGESYSLISFDELLTAVSTS
ncbi:MULTISPECIES: hypothetical protein [unclassified Ruegeria]|uniref:hypothetical protein n=1 Tax=unclassified Ruegeria TaxID=2625375 RepID=UPI001ADA7951|nr:MULTISPECIES: hypothetical protein [unclassified Ruegeria]MBO9417718.1 hypothetical protein [Ruegeria sp. R8_2]